MDVGFRFRIQQTGQFFDRAAAQQLGPVVNKYLRWSGMETRRAARRLLKFRRKKVKELTPSERERWNAEKLAYREGKRPERPQLPQVDSVSRPGDPPHLNFQPNPLRDGATGILFTLDDGSDAVVVGPSPFRERAAEAIERRNPFMSPALEKVRPRLPAILRKAAA